MHFEKNQTLSRIPEESSCKILTAVHDFFFRSPVKCCLFQMRQRAPADQRPVMRNVSAIIIQRAPLSVPLPQLFAMLHRLGGGTVEIASFVKFFYEKKGTEKRNCLI
jgi:hypothetical protein